MPVVLPPIELALPVAPRFRWIMKKKQNSITERQSLAI